MLRSYTRLASYYLSFCWREFAIVIATIFGLFPSTGYADNSLMNNQIVITGPLEVRFDYTDANGIAQDLTVQQLPQAVFVGLPAATQQVKNSPLLPGSAYFDQIWSSARSGICGDAVAQVASSVTGSPNSAYNINCTTNPRGALLAVRQTGWADAGMNQVNGQRLLLDYWIPDNAVTFAVTSSCTCKQSNAVCAADPQFTAVFSVHLTVAATNLANTLALPLLAAPLNSITVDEVLAGDQSGPVLSATEQWGIALGTSVATGLASAGTISAVGLVASTAKWLAQLSGIAVAGVCNDHLRDAVSSDLSLLNSATANSTTVGLGQQFTQLYQNLFPSENVGFSGFDIVAGSDGGLVLRLTQPPAAKPTLVNSTAATNAQPSLFRPTLAADQPQVKAGGAVNIHGNFFEGAYTTQLSIGWNSTVTGMQYSMLEWGPQNGQLTQAKTSTTSFEATNFSPGGAYQFLARDCNSITCSPWSDALVTSTQAPGSDAVIFRLDSLAAAPIGNAILGSNGTFLAEVTIPAGTPAGEHTLYATAGEGAILHGPIVPAPHVVLLASPGTPKLATIPSAPTTPTVTTTGQQASMMITVCSASGCQPAIEVMDPSTGAAFPPGGRVSEGGTFTLSGMDFPPGQAVTVAVDQAGGQEVGAATADSNGSFEAKLTMPNLPGGAGSHTLVAAAGAVAEASVRIFVDAPLQ